MKISFGMNGRTKQHVLLMFGHGRQLRAKNEVVGYILCGAKLSGNTYSNQDKDFLSIAANEIAVAIRQLLAERGALVHDDRLRIGRQR